MIIGNGMIARRFSINFSDNDRVVVFASGVSNSSSTDHNSFLREETMLAHCLEEHGDKTLVYFGTCSIFDTMLQHSAYILHKKKMEMLIRTRWPAYLICRTTNIIGKTENPHTLVNHLYQRILAGREVEVWTSAQRNLLDIDDLHMVVSELLPRVLHAQTTVNVFHPRWLTISEIIVAIENHLGIPASCRYVSKGNKYEIPDDHNIALMFSRLGIYSSSNYFSLMLNKYYLPIISSSQHEPIEKNTSSSKMPAD